ncbi:excisionase family DNA-binding protein [uncultured Piscinibacter sp.]|mgnify:CR=1 FL=1|uniref:excisionase family DNA-binding protein n=1 Tax=uncultured Piscinibacter sp. TaxID=1131835 RepID=UPI002606A016|nr:excisionase family DNA-binding protein [uncultured Piscinibacter sp.]
MNEQARPAIEPLNHSPERAGVRLGVSTRKVYEAIASGELRSFKLGKRRLIPDTELQRFVQRKLAEAA